jgi:inorganic pyrophosphatase
MNPWHDVALGDDPETLFQAIVEIPRGSKNKYELDKETGLLRLDRVLHSAVHYPANYGLLPRTYCEDGDPLDVLVLCQEAVVPLCILPARPIGVIRMTDAGKADDKVIAVAAGDPEHSHYADVSQLAPHRLLELRQFLLDYKTLEGKQVDVEEMQGREAARRVIREAAALYRARFGPG